MNTKRSVAKALLDIGAVGFSPKAPLTFKSGILSPVYVDNRSLIYHPEQWRIVVDGFADIARRLDDRYDVIAGVALGGIPHASALAYQLARPSVFIRKQSKAHGRGKRIEGGAVKGRRVLLVEDLITTGGSSLSAVDALRDAGALVSDALAIVSYGFDEARKAFDHSDVALHTLTDFATLLDEARDRQLFSETEARLIERWFAEPHHWRPSEP